jgi:mutator protein MutT
MKKELEVVAALIKKGDKFLLCQRKAQDHYGLLWEFPGGAAEKDESFSSAIEREIKEELGLEVRAGRVIEKFFDEDENLKIKVFLFACRIVSGTPQKKDCHDFGFFAFSEIEELNLAPADKKIYAYLKDAAK